MPEVPPARRTLSITLRLAGGYTLVSLLTLSLAAVILYGGLRSGFEKEDSEMLSDRIGDLRREVMEPPGDMRTAREEILHLAGDRKIEKIYGRLLDASGKVIVETPGAAEIIPAAREFPSPQGLGEREFHVTDAVSPAGNPVWVVAGLVPAPGGGAPLHYQLALDTSHVRDELDEFRETLCLVVAASTALTALLGWGITRRSLRPLAEISAAAQRVTASGLADSIGEKPWPRELVSLAGEFDGMLARLRESFERLSQFTADAAHEFRTPLNNLLGASSLALSRPRTAEEYRSLLESNLEEFQRLNHMMESLLFLARADNAQNVARVQLMDAGQALSEVAEFFFALAEDRGVALKCEGSVQFTADPALLRMALSNLVSNAIRHSPPGTSVVLHAAPDAGGCLIIISDEGEGIAPEHLPRLFDRFYRADASRATEGGITGSGLGLALVKTIMQLHGGSVSVESTVGTGTTFRLVFPAVAL